MNDYLPEGMGLQCGGFTLEQLRRAKTEETILQAPAILCDEGCNLQVDLGCCIGHIPRGETVQGLNEGTTREIAVLSRVGKPVSFRVVDFFPGGAPVLSRRLAQMQAQEYLFSTCRPGDILPAVVCSLAEFGAFCDIGCGLQALLGIAQISVSRINHSSQRFREDQQIRVAIRSMDDRTKRIQLTHKELLGTWAENADRFRPGQTVTGIVRSVRDYGVFVELAPNLSGLAEPDETLRPGDAVSVYLKSILPDQLKIKLVVLKKLGPQPQKPLQYVQNGSHLDRWRYGNAEFPKMVTVF